MLTAIKFKNFRSYQEARLPLSPLTVLIGANASGKSNAIEGMRFLAWLAQGQKLSAIQHSISQSNRVLRGRVEDLGYGQSDTFGLGCESDESDWNTLEILLRRRADGLHIADEALYGPEESVPLYRLKHPSRGQRSDVLVAYNNFKSGGRKPQILCSDQFAIFTQLISPASLSAQHKEAKETIPVKTKAYAHWLSQMLFLDPQPMQMRDYSFRGEKRLQGDGGNLSGVLFDLWGDDSQAQKESVHSQRATILSFIQSLPEQNIAGLSFLQEPRGGVMVQLHETFGGKPRKVDASLLSDGTLRVLAIAAAMLSADENSLVVIEEIDNGVHPSRARHLLTQIRDIAERRKLRVLLSTHNPALLDALPDSAIPDVVFCYRDPQNGASRLLRLSDFVDYPELIAQGSLGQLATSGLLDRVVKQGRSEAERRSQSQAWLEKKRSEAKFGGST